MTKQIYFDRLEKGIKIIRTYNIMINGQQNYKTLPHYMKVFGDFCVDYLKYKTVEISADINREESVSQLVAFCKANTIEIVDLLMEHIDLVEKCKDAQYTDVAKCMPVMPLTTAIIMDITKELDITVD